MWISYKRNDQKIITKADRIRAMNDEELAEEYVFEIQGLSDCTLYFSGQTEMFYKSYQDAADATVERLRQPAEED